MADATSFLVIPYGGEWNVRDFLRILSSGSYRPSFACEGGFILPHTRPCRNPPQIRTFGATCVLCPGLGPYDSLWHDSAWQNTIHDIPFLRMQPKWDVSISELHAFIQRLEQFGHKVVRTFGFRRDKNYPVKGGSRLEPKLSLISWYFLSNSSRRLADIQFILTHRFPNELVSIIVEHLPKLKVTPADLRFKARFGPSAFRETQLLQIL